MERIMEIQIRKTVDFSPSIIVKILLQHLEFFSHCILTNHDPFFILQDDQIFTAADKQPHDEEFDNWKMPTFHRYLMPD